MCGWRNQSTIESRGHCSPSFPPLSGSMVATRPEEPKTSKKKEQDQQNFDSQAKPAAEQLPPAVIRMRQDSRSPLFLSASQ